MIHALKTCDRYSYDEGRLIDACARGSASNMMALGEVRRLADRWGAQELPFPGQQFVQTRSGKISDPEEDVGEPSLGIDVRDYTS